MLLFNTVCRYELQLETDTGWFSSVRLFDAWFPAIDLSIFISIPHVRRTSRRAKWPNRWFLVNIISSECPMFIHPHLGWTSSSRSLNSIQDYYYRLKKENRNLSWCTGNKWCLCQRTMYVIYLNRNFVSTTQRVRNLIGHRWLSFSTVHHLLSSHSNLLYIIQL